MPDPMPFGAVIATANLVDCVKLSDVVDGVLGDAYGWMLDHMHAEGPFCFVLEDVEPVEPVEFRGAQGFFMVPDRLIPVDAR